MAALPEMDDLLDGLEEEEQKERKAKAVEPKETIRSRTSTFFLVLCCIPFAFSPAGRHLDCERRRQ